MNTPHFKSTFYSSILFYSRFSPNATAASFSSHSVSYAEFAVDIERATRRLHSLSLPTAVLAIVHVTHPYLHWVLTIALGRLGIASATVYDIARPGLLDTIQPDIVLTMTPIQNADARFVQVDQSWIAAEMDSLPPFIDPVHRYDTPFRFVLSSGTTGEPKKILLTHGQLQSRLRTVASNSSLQSSSRMLSLVGFDTIGGFQLPMTVWSMGACVVLRLPNEDAYSTIVRQKITYALMAPIQLSSMLDALPKTAWPIPELTLYIGGSVLPLAIAKRARQRLTPLLFLVYGSTEAGMVARTHTGFVEEDPGNTGFVIPEVDLEIVDAAGTVVERGTIGEVRIRGEGCVTGYTDLESGTATNDEEVFRDGWFYPGDLGTLSDTNMLSILGRTKELMNFGGVKTVPDAIENVLRECPGVIDIAAFVLHSADGTGRPWVAIVQGQGYQQDTLSTRFKEHFPELPNLAFASIDSIPRNTMGKVLRNELGNLVREAIRRHSSAELH